jgi:ABC-type oligopeptide transport system ATPase subunit
MKPTCFISYCHDGINRDEVCAFVEWLKVFSKYKIDFIYDLTLSGGMDLYEFEAQLETVDAIICLLTRNYKRKTEDRSGGVYDEFKLIEKRYISMQDYRMNCNDDDTCFEKDFYFIPIIFSGEFESSVPNFVKKNNILCEKFVDFVFETKDGKVICSEKSKKDYEKPVKNIINNILGLALCSSHLYKKQKRDLLDKLFITSKGEYTDLPLTLHVKTKAYKKVLSQEAFYIIGRKGSGKTTVTQSLEKINNRYKGLIKIIANNYDMESTFGYFQNKINEISNVFNQWDMFSMIWCLFIHLYSIYIIREEYFADKLSLSQKENAIKIIPYIDNIFKNINIYQASDEVISKVLYSYSVDNIRNYMDITILKARNNQKYFWSDIKSTFTINEMLNFIIKKKRLACFYDILKECKKRILITLDGFDLKFDEFRNNTSKYIMQEQKNNRIEMERTWILSLMELCYDIKLKINMHNPLYEIVDICLTIPQDRFFELRNSIRDSIKYTFGRVVNLNWSGIELALLIRKRLEFINNYSTKKDDPVEKRFLEVLQNCYPSIPTVLQLSFDGRDFPIGLFQYMLRMSFWRPRDIIIFFSSIIPLAELSGYQGIKISSDLIERNLKGRAINIIKDEFISEYSTVIENIKDIILSFRFKNQILTLAECSDIVECINFNLPKCVTIYDKIRLLYEIGFLGIYASPDYKQMYNLGHPHAFIFNEGKIALTGLEAEMNSNHEFDIFSKQCKIIIHPIFTEYLNLKLNAHEVLCNYSWEYLKAMEINMNNPDF